MQKLYQKQVELLLPCLPAVASVSDFALKGGTALNLFVRQDFPRLSVDLDLNYLPLTDRSTTLIGIEQGLRAIKNKILHEIANSDVLEHKNNTTKTITKLLVVRNGVQIKIEPNLILRGTIEPPIKLDLAEKVSEEYKIAVLNVPIVAKVELYGSKICAALDRQHPRDLFDVRILLKEGITKEVKLAFLVYLISHNRPIHELLKPNRLNHQQSYQNEFIGMTEMVVSYQELEETREQLIATINNILDDQDKGFLLSVKKGIPNWEHLGLPGVDKLPGVMWKLMNLKKMEPAKYKQALLKLEQVLNGNMH